MLLVDTLKKQIEEDDELKLRIANSRPHKQLMHNRYVLVVDIIKTSLKKRNGRRFEEKRYQFSGANSLA
jgi:hypothetical protein